MLRLRRRRRPVDQGWKTLTVTDRAEGNDNAQMLTPILLSGGGRTGSTQIMALLGSDSRVAFDRTFPYESRYLTYFAKFASLLQRPDMFQFLSAPQLFNPNYLNFGGPPPDLKYVPPYPPELYVARGDFSTWLRELWRKFSCDLKQHSDRSAFYAEKAPDWLAPMVRPCMDCFTIYNIRDPRDIFISTNAFMKKLNTTGFSRSEGDTDCEHARRMGIAFIQTVQNYLSDRDRPDTLLVRYEDYALDQEKVMERISSMTGLELRENTDKAHFDHHATAKDINSSVNRWTREPIPAEVVSYLERILHEDMAAVGYQLSQSVMDSPARRISFAPGRTDLRRLEHSSDGVLEQSADCAVARVKGPDFYITLPVEPFPAKAIRELWICVKGEIGSVMSLYWRGRDRKFAETSAIHVPYRPAQHWSVLVLPTATHPEWKDEITELRLDLFNSFDKPHKGTGYIRWVQLVGCT
jgi:hypothetical protein